MRLANSALPSRGANRDVETLLNNSSIASSGVSPIAQIVSDDMPVRDIAESTSPFM